MEQIEFQDGSKIFKKNVKKPIHLLSFPGLTGKTIMANCYSQISLQIIFAVKNRKKLILPEFKVRLFKYISGIIDCKGYKPLAVNGVADHIHIFAGVDHTIYLPDFVRDLKCDSSLFINQNYPAAEKFYWQSGYGVFSYSKSQRSRVIRYIQRQEEHHARQTFKKEYLGILRRSGVEYNPLYLFEFFEETPLLPNGSAPESNGVY